MTYILDKCGGVYLVQYAHVLTYRQDLQYDLWEASLCKERLSPVRTVSISRSGTSGVGFDVNTRAGSSRVYKYRGLFWSIYVSYLAKDIDSDLIEEQ